jgi:predicted nucleotidyltransferase
MGDSYAHEELSKARAALADAERTRGVKSGEGVVKRVTDDGIEDGGRHAGAAEAFVEAVRERAVPGVEELFLFGSTARGEAAGLSSDVDFLAVIADGSDRRAVEEALEAAAYDVMLEHGPVVEVHALTRSEFERRREHDDPFVRRVLGEGRAYA